MHDPRSVATQDARAHMIVSGGVAVAAIVTFATGRVAVSAFVSLLLLVSYADLRGLLAERGHLVTFAIGAGGVGAFLWCGYTGELRFLPAFGGGLVLALLVSRIALNEAGVQTSGITYDLAATIGAAGIVGVLGAHILLVRAVPNVGSRGLLAFGLMVIASDVAAFLVGRWRGRHPLNRLVAPHKTWEGALAGFGASVVVGVAVGLTLDPPFDLWSGLFFGIGVGVLAPLGDLAFSAIKRSAGVKHSGTYLGGGGGALDIIDSALFTAPAFYWAFRTIAL